jgi:hypothetical protein
MKTIRSSLMAALMCAATALPGAFADSPEIPASDPFILELTATQTVASPVPSVIPKTQYQHISADGLLSVGPVDVVGGMSFQNDGKYAEQQSGYWGGFNATLDSGGVAVDLAPFSMRVGRFTHSDTVSSPYSLFVSSQPIPALLLDLSVDSEAFFYTSRWLGLNRKSRLPDVEDRGANIRTYGVRFNQLRVGFQDALVYADRQFDLEYLLNPIPGIFLQYAKVATGSPWSETGNDNSIMGLFADYTDPAFYTYAQLLVDDFNANAFLNPDSSQNPNMIAWSVGGSVPTTIGEFGFYHAGATKYTFQSFGAGSVGSATDLKYGYTYYPAVEYAVGAESRAIAPEDNYIGYLHGENNLAFLVNYQQTFDPVLVRGSLEYTLSGSKSPANPWQEYNFWNEPDWISDGVPGTRFLDDDYLESKLTLTARADAPLGRWSAFAELSAGFVVNELQLADVPAELTGPNNEIRYFLPLQSAARLFGGITIGGSYRLPL